MWTPPAGAKRRAGVGLRLGDPGSSLRAGRGVRIDWPQRHASFRRCRGMPSTVIRRFAYAPDTQRLTVVFVTGRIYEYLEVPAAVVDRFRAARSKGAYFNHHIRDRFTYRELPDERPAA